MTATTFTSHPAKESLVRQVLAALKSFMPVFHSMALENNPQYSDRLRAGFPMATTRDLARDGAAFGLEGTQKTQALRAFDTRFPTGAAYDRAHRTYLDTQIAANCPKPPAPPIAATRPIAFAAGVQSVPPSGPPPVVFVLSDKKKVEALAAAVGTPYATKLEVEFNRLNVAQQTGVISEFDVSHSGRVVKFMIASTRPWIATPLKALIRTVAISIEEGNIDDTVIKITVDRARKAVLDRDIQGGDETIRKLGADGFDNVLRTRDGKLY